MSMGECPASPSNIPKEGTMHEREDVLKQAEEALDVLAEMIANRHRPTEEIDRRVVIRWLAGELRSTAEEIERLLLEGWKENDRE